MVWTETNLYLTVAEVVNNSEMVTLVYVVIINDVAYKSKLR